jgi:hypothetical protein
LSGFFGAGFVGVLALGFVVSFGSKVSFTRLSRNCHVITAGHGSGVTP